MSMASVRPLLQPHEFACHVASCNEFGKTGSSNHLRVQFTSRPNRLPFLSFQSIEEASPKNAASTTRNAGSLIRDLCPKFFTGKTRLSRAENIGCSGYLRPRLSMAVQSVRTDSGEDCSVQHTGLITTIERQLSGTEGSCSGSYSDSGTLDRWLMDSVVEILRHLKEAPFIQFVHDSEIACRKPERQKVSQEIFNCTDLWTVVKKSILQSSPIGLILVQKLDQQTLTRACLGSNGEGTTDVWGILVEGQNVIWNACYILKTTRVTSSAGVCTHFCLTKAKCFGPSLQEQLEKIWLL